VQAEFLYGVQFYRPPHPPRNMRPRELERIARELGFNTIKLFAQWGMINRREGSYDFEEIAEILDICARLDLKVVINTILENAPYWLEQRFPEARYVDAHGRARSLGGNSNTQSGGHPGLCLTHAGVRVAAMDYLRALALEFAGSPALLLYDCWNEPHMEPVWDTTIWADGGHSMCCYCASSQQEFRAWLQQRYSSDIEKLNAAWVRGYSDWEQVQPPRRHGTYADWLDWRRFTMDSLAEQMALRARTLREADPEHRIMSHTAALAPHDDLAVLAADNWQLASHVDTWGVSLFPHWLFPQKLHEFSMRLDIARSSAAGKEFWISELQGGIGKNRGLHASAQAQPSDIRLWNWLGVTHGPRAILYWCYMVESTATESSGFGLVRGNGEITPRAEEAVRTHKLLQRHAKILTDYAPEPQVAILFDSDAALLNYAMEGEEVVHTCSHKGYYRAVWQADLLATYVRPADLETLGVSVLIAPFPWMIDEETARRILWFVQEGGTCITEASFGLFDRHGIQRPIPLAKRYLGIEEGEMIYPPSGAATGDGRLDTASPLQCGWPIASTLSAYHYLASLRGVDGEAIISQGDEIAGIRRQEGKGTIVYFGTSVGGAIAAGDRGALVLMKNLLLLYCQPTMRGNLLRPRLIESAEGSLLVVINPENETVRESVALPSRFKQAEELYSNSRVIISDRSLALEIPPHDVNVWLLS
jgi:beta-galactosidase